jgi:hypothetical protein
LKSFQLTVSIEQEGKKLEQDMEQNKSLHIDVERYRDRQKQLDTVKLCDLKLPWLEWEIVCSFVFTFVLSALCCPHSFNGTYFSLTTKRGSLSFLLMAFFTEQKRS